MRWITATAMLLLATQMLHAKNDCADISDPAEAQNTPVEQWRADLSKYDTHGNDATIRARISVNHNFVAPYIIEICFDRGSGGVAICNEEGLPFLAANQMGTAIVSGEEGKVVVIKGRVIRIPI